MSLNVALRSSLLRWFCTPHPPSYCLIKNSSQCMKMKIRQFPVSYPAFTSIVSFSESVASQASNEKKKKNRSVTYVKISLIETDGNVTVTSLEEAEKISKRRDLKLVKIVDKQITTERPLYKMMTARQYYEEELESRKLKKDKKKTETKAAKLLTVTDKIGEHDLEAKCKQIKKWLEKNHEVRIVITESEESLSAHVSKTMESAAKEFGKIVQKRQKGKDLRFSILPVKKEEPSEQ